MGDKLDQAKGLSKEAVSSLTGDKSLKHKVTDAHAR